MKEKLAAIAEIKAEKQKQAEESKKKKQVEEVERRKQEENKRLEQ